MQLCRRPIGSNVPSRLKVFTIFWSLSIKHIRSKVNTCIRPNGIHCVFTLPLAVFAKWIASSSLNRCILQNYDPKLTNGSTTLLLLTQRNPRSVDDKREDATPNLAQRSVPHYQMITNVKRSASRIVKKITTGNRYLELVLNEHLLPAPRVLAVRTFEPLIVSCPCVNIRQNAIVARERLWSCGVG